MAWRCLEGSWLQRQRRIKGGMDVHSKPRVYESSTTSYVHFRGSTLFLAYSAISLSRRCVYSIIPVHHSTRCHVNTSGGGLHSFTNFTTHDRNRNERVSQGSITCLLQHKKSLLNCLNLSIKQSSLAMYFSMKLIFTSTKKDLWRYWLGSQLFSLSDKAAIVSDKIMSSAAAQTLFTNTALWQGAWQS